MIKFKPCFTILFIVFTFFITLGLAVSLRGVFAINIGSTLNLQDNKITKVGPPSAAGEATTWDFVNSAISNLQIRVTGSCSGGKIIRAMNQDGSVVCQSQ